jgi:tetratricopeptide (TPR) repeat protein
MTASRVESLLAMRERNPGDVRVLFALAMEYEKADRWNDVVDVLTEYLATADDQGNAWGRLGNALLRLDRTDEALVALKRGLEAASRHGHPGMAAEFEERLADLDATSA